MQFFVKIAEFSRKFALKNSEKVYEVGVRFSLEIRKRVWKWFETPRRLYSVEVPGKRQGVLFILFKKNAFLQLWKLQKLRVSRVLRVLRVFRALCALRALWFQCFAVVFFSRRCFGLSLQLIVLFEKMSKLRGVENAHTWRHMVRLTQRSTMSKGKCGFLKDLKG